MGLAALVGTLTFFGVGDGDFWTHLRTGAWIAQHHTVPHANLYMYTTPGYPWVCHTWLTSLVFYALYRLGGLPAEQVMEWLCVAGSFALLYRFHLRAGNSRHLGWVLFALGIGTARSRFDIRPEIFSGVLSAALLYLLLDFKLGNRREVWCILLLTALWTNFHATVVTAVLILGLFVAGEAIHRLLNQRAGWKYPHPLTAGQLRHIVIVAALTLATVLINPYGLHYFESLSPGRLAMLDRYLTEWRPLRELIVGFDKTTLGLMLLFTLAVIYSFIHARRSLNLSFMLLFVVFTFLTLKSSRQIWTWVQLSLCLAAVNFSLGSSSQTRESPAFLRLPLRIAGSPAIGLLVVVVTICQAIYFSTACGFVYGFGTDYESVPVGAVRFMKQNDLRGRLFNDEIDSGYLSWQLYPEQKLFIDGMNAYGQEIFQAAQTLRGDEIRPEEFEKWDFEISLVPGKPYFRTLLQLLRSRHDWALVYWDGVSFLFVKRLPRFATVISREEYRFVDPTLAAMIPEKFAGPLREEIERGAGNPVQTAALYTTAGDLSLGIRDLPAAERYYREARERRPNAVRAMVGLGRTERLLKKFQAAEQVCRRALFFQPQLSEAWRVLGLTQAEEAAQRRGSVSLLSDATRSLEKALARGAVRDYEIDRHLSIAYLQLGRFVEAKRALERMIKLYPSSPVTLYAMAVTLSYEKPMPQERILECLRKALQIRPGMKVVIRNDQSLAVLRDNPEFRSLVMQ